MHEGEAQVRAHLAGVIRHGRKNRLASARLLLDDDKNRLALCQSLAGFKPEFNELVTSAHCERDGFDTRTIRITVDPSRPDDLYVAIEVSGVIRGLRHMATQRNLRGTARKNVQTAATYFEKNAHRMRYDEYLAAGYPIATGVIEGACLHLVKDRMERSGMRWRLTGAVPMLAVRALRISNVWEPFQNHHQQSELQRLHPHRHLLKNYTPEILAI